MADNNDILVFEPMLRKKFPVLISLFGFSGCGKTLSAIKIAQGLGGKSILLDTEAGRGRVYADDAHGFDYAELTPPFTPERYISAIKQIERAGYDNLVLDSGSHEWDGLGGMLDIAENNVTAAGNAKKGLGKWAVKHRHKAFMNTLMSGRLNVIISLRAKDLYTQSKDSRGNEVITRAGFVPLQERNFNYDMLIQLPMPANGEGRYLIDRENGFKCPRDLLGCFKEGQQIDESVGQKIAAWVALGQNADQELRMLKNDAQDFAEMGTEAFRKFWATLDKSKRAKLAPFVSNFKSVAEAADLENEGDATLTIVTATTNAAGVDLRSLDNSPKGEE